MSFLVVIYGLTALAGFLVLLTQLPLGLGNGGRGRLEVGRGLVNLHTVTGVVAIVTWVMFLVGDPDTAAGSLMTGIASIGFWWLVSALGLLMLVRWLPTRGRHAPDGDLPRLARSAFPSVVTHLTMLAISVYFTWAYLIAAV